MNGDSPWDKYANAVFIFRTENPLFTCYLEKPCSNIVMLPPPRTMPAFSGFCGDVYKRQ